MLLKLADQGASTFLFLFLAAEAKELLVLQQILNNLLLAPFS